MAEAAEAAEVAVEEKGSNKKMIIMGGAAVLLVIICGIGGYFLGAKNSSDATAPVVAAATAQVTPTENRADASSQDLGSLIPLEEIIVNLLDDQETRYLKAALTLELDSPTTADEITKREPQVRDAIILLMSNKTLAELHDLQGKLQLRAELVERINSFLPNGKVKNIYFTDFIVQ